MLQSTVALDPDRWGLVRVHKVAIAVGVLGLCMESNEDDSPFLEQEVRLATSISMERMCGLACPSWPGHYRWSQTAPVVGQHVDLRDEIRKISLDIRLTGGDDSRPS